MLDLTKFAGTLPYSAELFGVYQPLLGWRARRGKLRLEPERIALVRGLLDVLKSRSPRYSEILRNPLVIDPDDLVLTSERPITHTLSAQRVRAAALQFKARYGRLPNGAEWVELVDDVDLAKIVSDVAKPRQETPDPALLKYSAKDEAVVAGVLQWWAKNTPDHMADLLGFSTAAVGEWLTRAADPLAHYDPQAKQAVLSPVGLVTLFRQYFFEFDSFLGPPVGHVWVSPGGSLEVYEVHTRRTRQERETEMSVQTMTRTEVEAVEEDELSTAVSSANSRDISLGVSAEVGVDVSVVQASASVSFGLGFTNSSASEQAHRRTRRQSEQLSNEIRRNFRTVFRTSVETEDVSSKRYVLKNDTDKLANYELRRKMRQVGVQVQQLGTQLCWQTYVDNPGWRLGLGMLVHAAQPEDINPDTPPAGGAGAVGQQVHVVDLGVPLHAGGRVGRERR